MKRTAGQQSRYMGRFKVNTKTSAEAKQSNKQRRYLEASALGEDLDSLLQRQVLLGSQVELGKRFNPFDATLLGLGPKSERLVFYCELNYPYAFYTAITSVTTVLHLSYTIITMLFTKIISVQY